MKTDRTFYIAALGNAVGSVTIGNRIWNLSPGKPAVPVSLQELASGVLFRSQRGKFADSEDSFLFCYTEVDPFTEGFSISAETEVTDTGMIPDFQTGYGILVADTVLSAGSFSRHRNHLAVGRFRTFGGLQHAGGVRAVKGYTDSAASLQYGRITDTSRRFSTQKENDAIETGDRNSFCLCKNENGFLCSCDGEEIPVSGHDFLTKQKGEAVFAGFAVAGKAEVMFRNISLETVPGTVCPTPEGEITDRIMDYPFERDLLGTCRDATEYFMEKGAAVSGNTVIIPDGMYEPDRSLLLGSDSLLLKAEHPGKVILCGRNIKDKIPLCILSGSACGIEGVVFRNSLSGGLLICGNHNTVRNCEASGNGDTGILICALPGAGKEDWPAGNRVESCVSHDNCDTAFCNADGFGAKLRIGEENCFIDCVAHHNVDDGFDLFTKENFGFTGRVTFKNCRAFENGKLSDGSFERNREGSGFKLGGERIGIAHSVNACRAWKNKGRGFDYNSNPFPVLTGCREQKNGVRDLRMRQVAKRILNRPEGRNPNRRSILFLIPSISQGGAERVTVTLANALCEKYNVSIAYYIDSEKEYPLDRRVNRVKFHGNHVTLSGRFRLLRRIRGFVCGRKDAATVSEIKRKLKADVTVSMLDYPNYLNAVSGGGRRVMSERNDPQKKGKEYFRSETTSFRVADAVIFQTEKIRKEFPSEIQEKGTVILNPVDVPVKASENTSKKIVTAGRLNGQKNHSLLLSAFAGFLQDHPGYVLHIYGEGPEEKRLREQAKKLGIEKAVRWEGYRNDVHERMKDAEFFVLSSDYEGLPNALMEALAMGLPCISTACTGAEELITDGENGLLVPVGDREGLRKAMAALSENEELRNRLSEKARSQAAVFRTETVKKEWEKVLFGYETDH